MVVRHNMLTESSRRPEAASAAILNEFVTLELALSLGSEPPIQSNGLALQRGVYIT